MAKDYEYPDSTPVDEPVAKKPKPAPKPVSTQSPVSLRELMKPKQTTQNKEDSDWLKVDDI